MHHRVSNRRKPVSPTLLFALNWLSHSHQRALRYTAATWSVPEVLPVSPVAFVVDVQLTAEFEQASPGRLR